jgi:hypothetical protein
MLNGKVHREIDIILRFYVILFILRNEDDQKKDLTVQSHVNGQYGRNCRDLPQKSPRVE